jgi:glutathione S-transferase
MTYFNGVLQTRPYVAGDQVSMADITVYAGLLFADAAQLKIPEECTHLLAWRARVAELPSVKHRTGQNFEAEDLRRLGF